MHVNAGGGVEALKLMEPLVGRIARTSTSRKHKR
jgi:hypothetical protein